MAQANNRNKGINNLNYSKMDTRKYFEYAAIFSEEDVRNSFISCVASVMDECDNAVILVEGQNGINRIAELSTTYEGKIQKPCLNIHKDAAEQCGIDAKVAENLLDIAAIIRSNTRLSITEAIGIVTAITENYNISHK